MRLWCVFCADIVLHAGCRGDPQPGLPDRVQRVCLGGDSPAGGRRTGECVYYTV